MSGPASRTPSVWRKDACRRAAAAVLGVLCLVTGGASRAEAGPPAYASTPAEASRELSAAALALMTEAEDEFDDAVRVDKYRRGLELARRAVAADDLNADAHFAVFAATGRLMLIEGAALNPINLLKVNRELARALELDPDHADALAARGGMYRQLPRLLGGDLRRAEADLLRSIELHPDAVGARLELAQTYRDQGDVARGIPVLEEAVRYAEQKRLRRKLADARRLLEEFRAATR